MLVNLITGEATGDKKTFRKRKARGVVFYMLPEIRLSTSADFPRLDELERACPMAGDTTLYIYRQGDYTRVLRFFTRGYMWMAEADDRLVGSVSWSWHTVLVFGRPEPVGLFAIGTGCHTPEDRRLYHDFTLT